MHNLPTSRKSRSTGLTREENVLSENPVDNNAAGKKCFNNCKKKKVNYIFQHDSNSACKSITETRTQTFEL